MDMEATMEIQLDIDALLQGRFIPSKSKYGFSAHTKWRCEDHYVVGYSTKAIYDSIDGEHDGKFACIVWKPNSRKNPTQWEMVYWRVFTKRKTAKEYALKHYYKHSPKRAKAHGKA